MTSFFISSFSMANAARMSVSRTQADLTDLQKEVVTGRLADPGLMLGSQSTSSFSLRAEKETVDGQSMANKQLSGRFQAMQNTLNGLSANAEAFRKAAIAGGSTPSATQTAVSQAKSSLDALTSGLNTTYVGRSLFSGAATDRPAISFRAADGTALPGYEGSTAQAATDAAVKNFLVSRGKDPDAPMSQADMAEFLKKDGAFDKLFATPGGSDDPSSGWANYSNAPTGKVYNRINGNERVNTAYSAGDQGFRDTIKSYVMLSDLGSRSMDDGARQVLTSRTVESSTNGIDVMNDMRATIGADQARLDSADENLKSRSDILSKTINSMESVDPYAASVRVSGLTNQLEASYALTARLSKLSLLNYL